MEIKCQFITANFLQLHIREKIYERNHFFSLTGESADPAGMIPLMEWKVPEGETDEVPYVWFYKEGLKEEKFVSMYLVIAEDLLVKPQVPAPNLKKVHRAPN